MDNTNVLMTVIELVAIIASFFLGRYVLPKYKTNMQDAITQFEVLLNYAESYVAYAKQFLGIPDSEKMDVVVEKLKIICKQQGIEVDEETLRAIGQKAYNNMKATEIPIINLETAVEVIEDVPINEEPKTESVTDTTANQQKKLDSDKIVLL